MSNATREIWSWYLLVQVIMGIALLAGLLVLIAPCLAHAWVPAPSFGKSRTIDAWRCSWLNYIWGNPEDGVSGQCARVWLNPVLSGPYMPLPAWAVDVHPSWLKWPYRVLVYLYVSWRAYRWSALRNSADNLKYVFARPGVGPMKSFTIGGKTFKFGWQVENGYNVPVF